MTRSLLLFLGTLAAVSAADFTGTWKLNLAKSKYEGMPAPTAQTATYTRKGTGWDYVAHGTAADGKPIHSTLTYVKDGEEIRTTGFPLWDSMVMQNGQSDKSSIVLKRGGQPVGKVTRTLDPGGKSLRLDGTVTTPEGKKATYLAVYDKQ